MPCAVGEPFGDPFAELFGVLFGVAFGESFGETISLTWAVPGIMTRRCAKAGIHGRWDGSKSRRSFLCRTTVAASTARP